MKTQHVCAWLVAAVVFSALGCSQQNSGDKTPDDEAMKWAKYDGVSGEKAAQDYFLPKYYYDPEKYDPKEPNSNQGIEDYFDGMDRIVVQPKGNPENGFVNPLEAPVFQLLDKGLPEFATATHPVQTPQQILGRNTWMIWCGGNEAFWDYLANNSLALMDLLRLLDSRERNTRFATAGVINEPEMLQTGAPAPDEFGLWLDVPADEGTRAWRAAYLKETFALLRDRKHKSQRGLLDNGQRKTASGDSPYGAYDYAKGSQPSGEKDKYTSQDYAYNKEKIPPPDIYGLSSGIVGLRLFPNPYFDKAAQDKWDAEKYYNDAKYYKNPELVRPFRIGMSCAFCHASFHPLSPPRDIANPGWENVSGNIGAQYLRIRAVFGNLLEKNNFLYHLLDSQPPGTIDTSLIASDNINNPNAMNAVFNLPQRVVRSFENPQETLSAASHSQPSVWSKDEFDNNGKVPQAYLDLIKGLKESNKNPRFVPRILVDGADSIGAWGALARVYLNIGTYYEQWIRVHVPLIGFKKQSAFTIADCEKHSVYWQATQLRVPALRDYFLKISPPMPLLAAKTPGDTRDPAWRLEPIDEAKLREKAKDTNVSFSKLVESERAKKIDVKKLPDGRKVFARNCIVCHSSIQPESEWWTALFASNAGASIPPDADSGPQKQWQALADRRKAKYAAWQKAGEFWEHDPGQWLRDPEYIAWADVVVENENFWRWNYLSTDFRIPVNVVKTNSGRAVATNALDTNVWDDFASESYQKMPSVGAIEYFDPFEGEHGAMKNYTPRHKAPLVAPKAGGGPGFYRVPSLVSIWTTAPLLHNNSLGKFNNDPSVDGRLEAFDDAIHKLLWPERRLESSSYNNATPERLKADHGLIWRTPQETAFILPGDQVPHQLERVPVLMRFGKWFPFLRSIHPLWLPSLILLVAGFTLLTIESRKLIRWVGYVALLVAVILLIYWLCYLWRYSYYDYRATNFYVTCGWHGVILLLVALACLLPCSAKCVRFSAYFGLIVPAILVGLVLYFVNGHAGDVKIGPIPKGTPVNLLVNANPDATPKELKEAIKTTIGTLAEIDSKHLGADEAQKEMREKIAPALMKINKCPDFVMDKGHYFPWFNNMTDDDKEALIELLKTF